MPLNRKPVELGCDINLEGKMELTLVLLFALNAGFCVSNDVVPVLIWGNKNVPDLTTPTAGHSMSSEDFADAVLKQLNQDNTQDILIFLQDQLSLDDITHGAEAYNQNSDGGDFQNIKSLMTSHPSTHLPRVASPVDAIDLWKKSFGGLVHELRSPYSIDDVPLTDKGRHLIIVHLKEAETLKKADAVIGMLSSRMNVLGRQYSAIYTAGSPSKSPREHLYLGRHLLATDEMPTHFYNISSCLFFYVENITFQVKNKDKSNMTWYLDERADTNGSACSPEPKLVLNFKPVSELKYLKLTVTFKNTSTGYWEAKDWLVSYDVNNVRKTDAPLAVGSIYAPYKHSYHCTTPKVEEITNKTSGKDESSAMFQLKNLQLQGYKISKDQFGRVSDCIGFFTIPIWMGIISMSVMITILIFGVVMLRSIKTMDRFDDPKGKTITVNVSE